MLKWMELDGVGPAPHLRVDFAQRINVLTGDNGLGKTFLLDVAWWALSQSWAGRPGWPRTDAEKATIRCSAAIPKAEASGSSLFSREAERWSPLDPELPNGGIVLYARVDGGFSIWDSYRQSVSSLKALQISPQGSFRYPPPRFDFHFDHQQVWDGLVIEGRRRCEGLIRDWVSWQRGRMPEFEQLETVLRVLVTPDEQLEPAEPMRVSLADGFDTPCIATRYGVVPLTHASAGVRRIVALAYLLVWAWREHCIAAKLLKKQPERRILLLIDEPETHLHPKWQRLIVPALLQAVKQLLASEDVATQIITATHSPLVLASLEPEFDEQKDALFELEYEREGEAATVALHKLPWRRHGDASAWLRSEPFDLLGGGYSPKAERLLAEAAQALSAEDFDAEKGRQLDAELRTVLGETDPFWIRWRFMAEKRGWLQ